MKKSVAEDDEAYCTVCRINLRPQKADLKKHGFTENHRKQFTKHTLHPKLSNVGITVRTITNEAKLQDLKLAVYVAIHSATRSIDHLGEILAVLGKGSKLEDLKLHRTKCSMLIQNVIGPSVLQDIINDIGGRSYSLIIDESTDISVMKYLCVCVRYFSISLKRPMTAFLGIIEIVVEASAVNLSDLLNQFLNKLGLNIKNLIGLGTDGASNLCGKNHSVYTILKEQAPSLQLIKCVAHSLHLCSSKAAAKLPSQLDFLAQETYNWFSNSPLRQAVYHKIFDLININTRNKFHKLVRLSNTRWLVRANVVKTILNQWLELKTHFNNICNEKCYMARMLAEMYNDNQNYLYYTFLLPVLTSVNRVNLLFQSDNTDVFKVYNELYSLLLSVLRMFVKSVFLEGIQNMNEESFNKIKGILDNPLALIDSDSIDCGIAFVQYASKNLVSRDVILGVQIRCKTFLLTLAKELCERIPGNLNVVNAVKYFSVDKCLTLYNRVKFSELPLNLLKGDKTIVEAQWNDLINVQWHEVIGKEKFSSEEFWVAVYNYANAGQEFIFRDIANFALDILALPISNAAVERVFSVMNATKTKSRNKLHLNMLEALLHIKCNMKNFSNNQKCCTKFVPSNLMYQKFNSDMYKNSLSKQDNQLEEQLEDTITLFEDL